MTAGLIRDFRMHGSSGLSVLDSDFLKWLETHSSIELGEKIVAYSWTVDGIHQKCPKNGYWRVLPDSSGFICFESERKSNNCVLRDVFGKERMRLKVPLEMAGAQSLDAENSSTFDNISEPYTNPIDHKEGHFGITGWVGQSKLYFELDYHKGQFSWCRTIRD